MSGCSITSKFASSKRLIMRFWVCCLLRPICSAISDAFLHCAQKSRTNSFSDTTLPLSEPSTSELGTSELGTLELGTPELGTSELGTLELGTSELGTLKLGTSELL